MTAAVAYVVDASVAIKLFLTEPLSDRAEALFAHLAAEPAGQLSVPDLFYSECANILWQHTRRSGYPAAEARQALTDLDGLALKRFPTADLAAQALDLAVQAAITAYAACYVALALHLDVPLVTADEKLARALAETTCPVHWLGDFPITTIAPHP